MAPKAIAALMALFFFCVSAAERRDLSLGKRERMETLSAGLTEGDVECFSEYMELWVHRMRIEGLRLWLSGVLRIPVSLASLDDLNRKLSACGFSLYRDPDRNYMFRVLYSGCFVHLEHGNYIVSLSLTKRTSRLGGQSSALVMKCPLVRAPPSGEHVMCDPDFIQVTRRIPMDSWNNELSWSLALRGKLVVALEDASLIQLSVQTDGVNITIQGRREEILSPEEVPDTPGTFLPLRLVSGHYSYSMEASCPTGSDSATGETVLYIYKRSMGLVRRGGADGEALSLSAISVKQTDAFSVSESSDHVRVALNTSLILRTRRCTRPAGEQLVQPFFRVDAVLTFKEMPHRLVWSLENLWPCTEPAALSAAATETLASSANSGGPTTPSAGRTSAAESASPAFQWATSAVVRLFPKAADQGTSSSTQSGTSPRVSVLSKDNREDLNGLSLPIAGEISVNPSADTLRTQVLETSTEGSLLTASKNESDLHPFRRAPLIFGHSVMTTSSLQAELREQLPHTPISASEVLSVGSEVKDSGAETSTEMVISVETSSAPLHDSEEGAGWLWRNTSREGQAEHDSLFPERPHMITSGSNSLFAATSPRSEMDHSPKEDLLQKADSLLANVRPQWSTSSAAWLLLKPVAQGANLTNASEAITSPATQGTLSGVTFDILRGLRTNSPTDTHGTQTLVTAAGDVPLTIPKHMSDAHLSGRSPLIFDQPPLTTSDPQAEQRERPAYTTGTLLSDQMLLGVPTNSPLPSGYEVAASLLPRKTVFEGQAEHGITSPGQRSTIVSDSSSHSRTPSVLDHSTMGGFLLRTNDLLTKPTPPASIKIESDLNTPPSTPTTPGVELSPCT